MRQMSHTYIDMYWQNECSIEQDRIIIVVVCILSGLLNNTKETNEVELAIHFDCVHIRNTNRLIKSSNAVYQLFEQKERREHIECHLSKFMKYTKKKQIGRRVFFLIRTKKKLGMLCFSLSNNIENRRRMNNRTRCC